MIRFLKRGTRTNQVCYAQRTKWHRNDRNNKSYCKQQVRRDTAPIQSRSMSSWLLLSAGCVFGIVVVGGITRLTDSGLSMVQWKPLSLMPPTTEEEWEEEFDRYKQYDQYKKLFPWMTLSEFKRIFFWEWFHRILARGVGVVFGVPFLYFLARGKIRGSLLPKLAGLFALGGMQGVIGWWMVKSGLRDDMDKGFYPRVSQYRLALHLGSAFTIYSGLLWTGLSLWPRAVLSTAAVALPRTFIAASTGVFGLLFTTAIAGAFVAGLDAGLMYNTFPYMGDTIVPEEYSEMTPMWRNMFENGAAVQFNHRVLGVTSVAAVSSLWLYSRYLPLPPQARIAMNLLGAMGWIQASLGVATLLWLVPTPLAASHQAGSLVSISLTLFLLQQAVRTRYPILKAVV